MPKLSSLLIAKPQIASLFEDSTRAAFRQEDLKDLLAARSPSLKLAPSTSLRRFANFLIQHRILEEAHLQFPGRTFLRYVKPDCTVFELAASISKDAYLSHYSAVHLHDLSEQIPKTIYINSEQGQKNVSRSGLSKKNIELAFSRPWRKSNRSALFRDFRILWLNGMYTGNLGVTSSPLSFGKNVLMTDLERTLIDISVRPIYAGGVFEVLKAFRTALPRVEIDKLVHYLKALRYIYPYHQVIGFYLEKAGAPNQEVEKLRDLGLHHDFYLTHQIGKAAYSEEWRLYYPSGL